MAIHFCGRANVKYFMQTQLLRFYKGTAKVSSLPLLRITTKSTHFLSCEEKDREAAAQRCSWDKVL